MTAAKTERVVSMGSAAAVAAAVVAAIVLPAIVGRPLKSPGSQAVLAVKAAASAEDTDPVSSE